MADLVRRQHPRSTDWRCSDLGMMLYSIGKDSSVLLHLAMKARTGAPRMAGITGGELDFALLVDGLQAEREPGITIDVAYRFFATKRRRFVVADSPDHLQYTRNMATGASSSDLAAVLIDARKGVITQTRRHSRILGRLGACERIIDYLRQRHYL